MKYVKRLLYRDDDDRTKMKPWEKDLTHPELGETGVFNEQLELGL